MKTKPYWLSDSSHQLGLLLPQMQKWYLYIRLLFVSCSTVHGQQVLEVSPNIRQLYSMTANLELDEAIAFADSIKKVEPDNMMVYHMEHYIDFYEIFITEDDDLFSAKEDNLEHRLDLIQQASEDCPYYLFCQAEMELMWALIRLKWDQKYRAAGAVLRAYRLLEKNVERYPDFQENYKSLSIIHAMAESLPAWIRTIVGISGNVAQGTDEILRYVDYAEDQQSMWYQEGVVVASYMLFYLNNEQEAAWALLQEHELDLHQHPLLTFIYSNMAQRLGKNELAIQLLEERPRSEAQLDFAYLDLLLGKCKLYRLDADADKYLRRYVEQFEGRHFIKEAYQKLAWHQLAVNNSEEGYLSAIEDCIRYGESLTDEDKQALTEARKAVLPDRVLLRARLLFDGGYYDQAYSELVLAGDRYGDSHPLQESYLYRVGRVLQQLGNPTEALEHYQKVLSSTDNDSYERCNAALQSGLILESQGRPSAALQYYVECLDIPSTTYRASLHQKAKTGIDRVQNNLEE